MTSKDNPCLLRMLSQRLAQLLVAFQNGGAFPRLVWQMFSFDHLNDGPFPLKFKSVFCRGALMLPFCSASSPPLRACHHDTKSDHTGRNMIILSITVAHQNDVNPHFKRKRL